VAGATGYIGRNVLNALRAERPDLRVLALARRPEAGAELAAAGAEPVTGDLGVPGEWQTVARKAGHVIHVAQPGVSGKRGTTALGRAYERERQTQDRNLLEALDPAAGQRIVYVSGHSFFGRTPRGVQLDETMKPDPLGFGERGLDVVSVYPSAVYGYGSWTRAYTIDRLLSGKKLMALPGEPPKVSPIHVYDCARAIVWMLQVPPATVAKLGRDFLLADDRPVTNREMGEAFAAALHAKPAFMTMPGFLAKLFMGSIAYDYMTSNFEYSNARLKETGFAFRFPTIDQGVPEVSATALAQKKS
jgi:nucleoside-diphosphate-sugar epimerase